MLTAAVLPAPVMAQVRKVAAFGSLLFPGVHFLLHSAKWFCSMRSAQECLGLAKAQLPEETIRSHALNEVASYSNSLQPVTLFSGGVATEFGVHMYVAAARSVSAEGIYRLGVPYISSGSSPFYRCCFICVRFIHTFTT